MAELLDWIRADELLTLLVLIGLLIFAGQQLTSPSSVAYRNARRLAGFSIVLYAALAFFTWPPASAADVLDVVIRSLLAGGVAFGAGTVVLGALSGLVGDPVAAIRSWFHRWKARSARQAAEGKAKREAAERERREQAELERTRPEREARRREAAEREALRQQEAPVREQLQFEVRLFYDRYRAELQSTFPPDVFESYLSKFLTEGTPLEQLEQRADQLKEMIRDRLEIRPAREKPDFQDIDDVIAHFAQRKQRIRELELSDSDDADVKDTMIAALDAAQDKAIRELLS